MKMDDQKLLSIIQNEEWNIDDSQLDIDRQKALDYYYGRPVGVLAAPEIPDRSSYVSRDVADTIDWIMPALMKTFLSGDDVVSFSPQSAEDVPAAEQETDYINHVVLDLNPAYEIFSTWFDDALIQKNGYVYTYWKETKDIEEEHYYGLTIDQITMLTQDPEVKISEATQESDSGYGLAEGQMGGEDAMQVEPTFHVALNRTNKSGRICIENIPPERVKISSWHKNVRLQESTFSGFDSDMTISDLREAGFDVSDDVSDDFAERNTRDYATSSRSAYNNRSDYNRELINSDDPSGRVVRVRYRWMRVDFDGDGIAELRYLMLVGKEILINEKADIIPIASITPRIVAHNHIGRSIEDVVHDLQDLKTQFLRSYIDNSVLANNGRYGVDETVVNLDDFMLSRPGGIVRVRGAPAGAIMPLNHSMMGTTALQALEVVDSIRETRTGVTKYNMGQDAGNLNKTATGISLIQSSANQRIEWIARTFAETGVRELFNIVHAMTRKHQDKPSVTRLRNQWVTVDPRDWIKRKDMTISVGLGSVNRQQQSGGIMQLGQIQLQAFQAGVVTPENVYNMAAEFVKGLGYKDPSKFFTHPSKVPPKQPQPDPKMEKVKADSTTAAERLAFDREKSGLAKEQQNFDRAAGQEQSEFDNQLSTLGAIGGMGKMMGGMDEPA